MSKALPKWVHGIPFDSTLGVGWGLPGIIVWAKHGHASHFPFQANPVLTQRTARA